VWPTVQFINMMWVPLQHRILVANLVSIPWTAYLSLKVAAAPTGKEVSTSPATSDAAADTDGSTVVDILRAAASGGAGGGVASTARLTTKDAP
jgi:hypothetical protein